MAAATATAPAVAMRHIDKRFGAVQANRDVALTVRAGSVHGIVGENGAGKSTLMSILYGFYQADAGEIEIEGRAARIVGSREAIALGVGMVHQHFMLVDTLSALDNVMLGAEPGWRLNPARAAARAKLDALMRDTGLTVDLDALVHELPVGQRQRLEILKALFRGARILILDEPTAVLTPQETAQLFATLRSLRAQGATILLVTHKLKEIMALADHVTVMRQGQVVLDAPIGDVTLDSLAEAMVGRRVHLGRSADEAPAQPGEVLLQAQGLRWTDTLGVPLEVAGRMMAPAVRSRSTTAASSSGTKSLYRGEPKVVRMPLVNVTSLMTTGRPCNGRHGMGTWWKRSPYFCGSGLRRRSAIRKVCPPAAMPRARWRRPGCGPSSSPRP